MFTRSLLHTPRAYHQLSRIIRPMLPRDCTLHRWGTRRKGAPPLHPWRIDRRCLNLRAPIRRLLCLCSCNTRLSGIKGGQSFEDEESSARSWGHPVGQAERCRRAPQPETPPIETATESARVLDTTGRRSAEASATRATAEGD